jgi:hypothetical protein
MRYTSIFGSCWACGQVKFTVDAIELHYCDNAPHLSVYRFVCPSCRQQIEKPACLHAIEALMSVGVRPIRWSLPAEALEAHDGPPLTPDDVLDLHQQLEAM